MVSSPLNCTLYSLSSGVIAISFPHHSISHPTILFTLRLALFFPLLLPAH
eukprot:m.271346 g.271346  ORF g.271346 m.271346 type:complete len:50 (-) comp54775_c0_seq5:408-557(-)